MDPGSLSPRLKDEPTKTSSETINRIARAIEGRKYAKSGSEEQEEKFHKNSMTLLASI
jgi:hypothetical protein